MLITAIARQIAQRMQEETEMKQSEAAARPGRHDLGG